MSRILTRTNWIISLLNCFNVFWSFQAVLLCFRVQKFVHPSGKPQQITRYADFFFFFYIFFYTYIFFPFQPSPSLKHHLRTIFAINFPSLTFGSLCRGTCPYLFFLSKMFGRIQTRPRSSALTEVKLFQSNHVFYTSVTAHRYQYRRQHTEPELHFTLQSRLTFFNRSFNSKNNNKKTHNGLSSVSPFPLTLQRGIFFPTNSAWQNWYPWPT